MKKVFAIILILFVLISINSCNYRETNITDTAKYGEFDDFERIGGLAVFPEVIPEDAEVLYYLYYSATPAISKTSYQICLNLKLTPEEYQKEAERISLIDKNTSIEGFKITSDIRFNENDFIYPAYVSVFSLNSAFEYVLLNEAENNIIYIYIQFTNEKDIKFDKIFLPAGYKPYGAIKTGTVFTVYG